jgi:hypothetical protein
MPTIIALAGRRIDAPDAKTPRFPLASVPLVRDRLRDLFLARGAGMLVCSAASGADLLALETAEALGLRRRIVLPFGLAEFRASSVTDRPCGWETPYNRLVGAAQRAGDLVVLKDAGEGRAAYLAANERILNEALEFAGAAGRIGPVPPETALALIVWEGRPRGPDDVTARFAASACRRGLSVEKVLTA